MWLQKVINSLCIFLKRSTLENQAVVQCHVNICNNKCTTIIHVHENNHKMIMKLTYELGNWITSIIRSYGICYVFTFYKGQKQLPKLWSVRRGNNVQNLQNSSIRMYCIQLQCKVYHFRSWQVSIVT